MTKYICLHCGHHFDTPKSGHEGGYPEEPTDECPNCGSLDIEVAAHCVICDDDFPEDQVVRHICKGCLEKNMTVENATKYGGERKVSVELNGFLAWVFDGRIDDILARMLPNVYDLKQLGEDYCADDKYDFAEWLEEHNDAE